MVRHTADFFVLRASSAGWEECKTQQELLTLLDKQLNRFSHSEKDGWTSPPGEDYAKELGLYYRVRSSGKINWAYQRNTVFLEDYCRVQNATINERVRELAKSIVTITPGLALSDLITQITNNSTARLDDIFMLIATRELYVDLWSDILAEPERVRVYLNKDVASRLSLSQRQSESRFEDKLSEQLTVGSQVLWDGKLYEVINIGDEKVWLKAVLGKVVDIFRETFDQYIEEGIIKVQNSEVNPPESKNLVEHICQASVDDLQEANRRYGAILPYLCGENSKDKVIAKSTIYRWISQYKKAEELFNCGYIGLLPEKKKRGNRIRKLPQEVISLMDESINKDYENVNQKSKYAAWVSLVSKCEEKQLKVPSYKTYSQEINNRQKYQSYFKRKGYKVAYEVEPFYWELEQTTSRHGDRPFEVVHIDHTELDIELICSTSNRNLGRPWLSLMMDAYSRRILAFFLGFDPPSYRSCMMVLRDCVRRHQRLPQNIIVDGGKEFESVYFETLLARYECTKKTRPSGKPRFGSVIERLFGTTNTQFIHNLTGNTQIRRNVRQIIAQVDPSKLAKWTLASLYELLHKWAYEVYETIEHPALGQSPRDTFIKGLACGGNRQHRLIAYDEEFLILTLPTTKIGKAKVIAGKGVVINHIYYWSETFRHAGVENTKVAVRYDPFDAGVAYAYVRNRWVRCISELYTRFQGHSQKELMLATAELRKRIQGHSKQFQVTANKLANFLASVETQEVLLSQRLQDNEAKKVIALMEGKTDKENKEETPKVEVKPNKPRKKSEILSANINTEEVNTDELETYEDY